MLLPRSPVIPELRVFVSKETSVLHHQSSICQCQRKTLLLHHLPTLRENQRDQLMDLVMKAEAAMITTDSEVLRPLIVSNALRENKLTLSEKQRD